MADTNVSNALSAAGLGVGAINALGSGISGYIASQAQARYQRAIADANAKIAAYKIKDATDRGDLLASQYGQKVDRLVGSQKASLAAQGIDIGDGSALQTLEDTKTQGALDMITIRNNAAREAFGFKLQSINDSGSGRFTEIATNQKGQSTLLGSINDFTAEGLKFGSKFESIFGKSRFAEKAGG